MKELFASVDLGGTKIAGAIAGVDGEILAEGRIATNSHEGPAGVLPRIAGLVSDLSARLRRTARGGRAWECPDWSTSERASPGSCRISRRNGVAWR